MNEFGFLVVLLSLTTVSASIIALITGRRQKAVRRELAAAKSEAAGLHKVLTAFRIDPDKSREMAEGPNGVWLERAGLFGAALIQSFCRVAPCEHNQHESLLMNEWLWSLPGYTADDLNSAKEHQEHIAEKWLLPLIKSE